MYSCVLQEKQDVVSCVRMVSSVDDSIAVGYSSGMVVVYQLPSFTNGGKACICVIFKTDWRLKLWMRVISERPFTTNICIFLATLTPPSPCHQLSHLADPSSLIMYETSYPLQLAIYIITIST
jgi:hypothetical protein